MKATPLVSAFLEQYPDASISTIIVAQGTVVAQIEEIKKDCEDFQVGSYYKSVLADADSGTKLTVWMNSENYQVACIVQEKSGVKTPLSVTPLAGETTTSVGQVGVVVANATTTSSTATTSSPSTTATTFSSQTNQTTTTNPITTTQPSAITMAINTTTTTQQPQPPNYYNATAQTFKPTKSGYFAKVDLYLSRVHLTGGTLPIEIRNGSVTGTILTTKTVNILTLPTSSYGNKVSATTIVFDSKPYLTANNTYAIIIKNNNDWSIESGRSKGSVYWNVELDVIPGEAWESSTLNGWGANTWDSEFKIYIADDTTSQGSADVSVYGPAGDGYSGGGNNLAESG